MKKTILAAVALTAFSAWTDTVFVREKAGSIWQDGVLVGDGATAAVGYAPAGLEWVVNRNDVLDSRVGACDYVSHEEVMACVKTNKGHSVAFLGKVEEPRIKLPADICDKLTLTLSAAILRVRFWPGVGWAMPSIPETRQALDTRTGELTETMRAPESRVRAVSFVDRSRDVMAVEIGDAEDARRGAWIELTRPEDVRFAGRAFSWAAGKDVVSFAQELPGGETYAVALSAPGGATTVANTARVRTSERRALFLAVRTTRDAPDPRAAAVEAVRAAERDGFAKVRADNRAWWTDFWAKGARARFDGAPAIDTQWNYALYALASQYGAAPMPGLNGLFYGPLGGIDGGVTYNCYVHDQNVQIPMMPFFPLGHADFVETFVKTYENALDALERQTAERFGAKGAYLPLNMNPFGREHPIKDYRYTLCGGAYSGLVLAQAWWYTHDETLLRRVYPLLKKFILFYTDTMEKGADGTYRFIWSVPPEIFTGSHDDTATIACLKPCLEAAVEAATRFGGDEKELALWKDVLAHYPKCAKHSEGGWWCGPEVPDDHYMYGGHLFYPFFPAESEPDAEMAKKTLAYTWKYGVDVAWTTPRPHPVHDWCALYTGMATTRAYGGERGWQALLDFFEGYAKPNGHFSHNPILLTALTREEMAANVAKAPKALRRNYHDEVHPISRRGPNEMTYNRHAKALVAPVIEGGASFLMLASEALCQSWGGEIRLFPSVPKGFTGRFENFRVRGGYVVSAEMKDGKVVDFDLAGAKKGDKIKVTCPTDPDFVQLPAEPAWKKPVGHGPFPDALSAFVFRNWTLVPAETLAETVGATADDVRRIAAEMGLDPHAAVPAEWKRGGYVTILRRNWQLLPYAQILKVVGMTRKELRHALMYDDFLLTKLGKDKPAAARVVYTPERAAAGRAARLALRDALAAEGVSAVDPREEPRFDFMRQLAVVPAACRVGARAPASDARFRHKLIFPYCADYGDVLADPDAASCSEGLIARLAERGVNALWFHVVLAQLSTDPKYPEWSVEAPRRRATLKKLVDRAARHGVKVYLYVDEPRSQPGAFFDAPGRAGMRGAVEPRGAGYYAMCTADPATLAWLTGCLKSVFTEVKGLGGVFTITMSETMTHCASAYAEAQKTCPKCAGKPYEHFVAQVNRAIVEGVKGGNPDAEVWFYDVGWEAGNADRRIIPLLPKEGSLLVWSEKKLPFEQAGGKRHVTEYSISHPGPSPRTRELWDLAAQAGLGTVAKLQVNCSWELSSVPYLPTMDLVAEHAANLAASPVHSVMLSWSQGGYPSPNLRLFDAFRRGDTAEAVLARVAKELYGEAAPAARAAWTAYSEAFRNYPIEWQTVYYAPVQMGAANLLYAKKTDWPATMVNTPYDDFKAWSGGYADNRAGWIAQMRACADGFAKGDALWREVVRTASGEAKAAARCEAGIFRAATLTLKTVVDQSEFILARDRGDRVEMRRRAAAELATAKEMLALVRADSRLGYESSNRYVYVPNDFLEKILNCRALLASDAPCDDAALDAKLRARPKDRLAFRSAGGRTETLLNGRPIVPKIYKTSGTRTDAVRALNREIPAEFARYGFNLFTFSVDLSECADEDAPERVRLELREWLRRAPEAHILLNFYVRPWTGWGESHPSEVFRTEQGLYALMTGCRVTELSETPRTYRGTGKDRNLRYPAISYCSELFLQAAAEKIRSVVSYLEDRPEGRAVVGAFLGGGCDGQWFDLHDMRLKDAQDKARAKRLAADYSDAARKGFRKFLRERYGTPEALAAAWGATNAVPFEAVEIPSTADMWVKRTRYRDHGRSPQGDYNRYMAWATAHFTDGLAQAVKKGSNGRLFAGGYYKGAGLGGYPNISLAGMRHRLRKGDGYDFIATVPRYAREWNDPVVTTIYNGSVVRRGRLYVGELDLRNPEIKNWGMWSKDEWRLNHNAETFRTEVLKFALAAVTAGGGYHAYDMNGGWYRTPAAQETWRVANAIADRARPMPLDRRRLAVVGGEDYFDYQSLGEQPGRLLAYTMRMNLQRTLGFSGVPFANYLVDEVLDGPAEDMPSLVVFSDLSGVSPEDFAELRRRYAKDGRVLVYLWRPCTFCVGAEAVEREFATFTALDGVPGASVRKGADAVEYRLDDPKALDTALLRRFAREAGVAPLVETDEITGFGSGLFYLQAQSDGVKRIRLPEGFAPGETLYGPSPRREADGWTVAMKRAEIFAATCKSAGVD